MHNKISGRIKAAGRHFWYGTAVVCKSWQGSLREGKSFSGAESQSFASGDCTAGESSFAERNNEWQRLAWWCGTEACGSVKPSGFLPLRFSPMLFLIRINLRLPASVTKALQAPAPAVLQRIFQATAGSGLLHRHRFHALHRQNAL